MPDLGQVETLTGQGSVQGVQGVQAFSNTSRTLTKTDYLAPALCGTKSFTLKKIMFLIPWTPWTPWTVKAETFIM
jgi:hypothetical protein